MKYMKKRIILTLALSFCLAAMVLLINLQLVGFNYGWYRKEFTGLDITGTYDIERVESQTKNIFAYLQNQSRLQTDYYTPREIRHLADIKSLIRLVYGLSSAAVMMFAAVLIFFIMNNRLTELLKIIMRAAIVSIVIILVPALFLLFDFEQTFFLFHELAFTNGNWILDPSSESLIVIFPPKLFSDLALTIAVLYLTQMISLIILAGAFKYYLSFNSSGKGPSGGR